MPEKINHPSHYGGEGPYEVVSVCEKWGYHKNHCRATAIEYLARAGRKEGQDIIDDLQKAVWWINREIYQITLEREDNNAI